jgi:hypothetical protein
MNEDKITLETYQMAARMTKIMYTAVKKALDTNRALGIPIVFSRNGKIYYELPNGEITTESPF